MCLFCIQPLAVRESVIPHCWITYITHLPSLGATLPFVHQAIWSGRQDSNLRPLVRSVYKIRTYDTSFIIQTHQFLSLLVNCNQNQCSSQLNYFPKCVVFYNTSDYHQPWELVSFTPTSDFHRRSPLVCTQPLWNSHCLLTCSLSSLPSVRFHIVFGILIPWTLTLWVYTWALFVFHFSYWSWTCLNNCHFLYFIVLLSSGCGSRTQLSWGYEPQMIFEHPYFRSSYPFHSPANFLKFERGVQLFYL